MQDNEKKPALRFKGFTDPWEQRKLGEIAVFSKGVGYSKNDLCEEGTPIILYGRLYTKYETCIFDVDTFVKKKLEAYIARAEKSLCLLLVKRRKIFRSHLLWLSPAFYWAAT